MALEASLRQKSASVRHQFVLTGLELFGRHIVRYIDLLDTQAETESRALSCNEDHEGGDAALVEEYLSGGSLRDMVLQQVRNITDGYLLLKSNVSIYTAETMTSQEGLPLQQKHSNWYQDETGLQARQVFRQASLLMRKFYCRC